MDDENIFSPKIRGVICNHCAELFDHKLGTKDVIDLLEKHYLEIHKDLLDENGKGRIKFSIDYE